MKPCSTIKHKSGKGMPELLRCKKHVHTHAADRQLVRACCKITYLCKFSICTQLHTFLLKIMHIFP